MGEQIFAQAHLTITDTTDLEWFYGTDLTHTSDSVELTGNAQINGAAIGSMYLNTQTSIVYKFTAIGNNGGQVWTYVGNLSDGVIDNIEVGGTNLLRTQLVGKNITIRNSSYRFADIPLTQPLKAGQTYTLQLWGVTLDQNSTGVGVYWGSGTNNIGSTSGANSLIPDENGYIIKTFTITAAQANHQNASNLMLYLYNYPSNRNNYNTTITKWKLEEGNIATSWSSAPEDTLILMNDAIDKIQIGAANLLRTSSAGLVIDSNFYRFATIPLVQTLIAGQTYTLQLWGITLDQNSTGIKVSWGKSDNYIADTDENLLEPNEKGYIVKTFTIKYGQVYQDDNIPLVIYLHNQPDNDRDYSATITRWKLEKGDKATSWTASSEELLANINELDEKFNETEGKTREITNLMEDISNQVENNTSALEGMQQTIEKTIQINDEDPNNPSIKIQAGTQADNSYVLIEENRISFHKVYEDNDENNVDSTVLYIDSEEKSGIIDINNARIETLKIGSLELFAYEDGIAIRRSD